MKWKERWKVLSLVLCLILLVTGTTLAQNQNQKKHTDDQVQVQVPAQVPAVELDGDLIIDSVVSTSLVPGEEARYTIAFRAPVDLDLEDAAISLDLPDNFSITQNDILDENPGCTLASLQYKNRSNDKYWSVLQGQTEVVTEDDLTTFTLQVDTSAVANVNSDVIVYLTLPGVVNGPDEGSFPIHILLQSATGNYEGQIECALGPAPAEAPSDLEIEAASSYYLDARWNPVDGASRYQLYFALDPNGYYIQACDFGKEPNPGQQWSLTETACSFTAKGNGDLEPGRTYYFKVRAGNEYGFGPFSEIYTVETPVLALDAQQGKINSPIIIAADQDVEIVDEDLIMLFKAATGEPVTAEVTADGNTISISADLENGVRYQAVFYKNALVSTDNIKAYNNLFGFEFVANGKTSK